MSEKTKRKIAVLMSGINEEYQRDILDGILDFAKRIYYDVYVFTCFGEGIHTHNHDLGEINIFNLPDFSVYDGVILLSNTMQMHSYINDLFDKVTKLNIPVVDIDNELDNAYCIEINNESAMKQIVEHFTDYHGFKRINFVSGSMTNPEARTRLKAYKDVLTARGIPVEEDRIFQGNFVREKGHEAAQHFINSSLEFPQAIICANDSMALAVHMTLVESGYRVPEDVCVAGFDNINAAENLFPQLTTVARPLKEVGAIACKKIYEVVNGIKTAKKQMLVSTPIFTESCGCPRQNKRSFNHILYDEYSKNYNLMEFITRINQMSQSLTESSSENIIEVLQPYVEEIDCECFYICLCEEWDKPKFDECGTGCQIKGYPKEMFPALCYENGKFVVRDKVITKFIVPKREENLHASNVYIIAPLHFSERCLGYAVTCNGDFPSKSILYHSWLMNIANYLENYRKQKELQSMIKKLDELYIRDPLTGLYNRRGFFRFVNPLFEEFEHSSIAFFDLDGLKYINDNFGHESGDIAIRTLATVLLSYSTEKSITARFGGDEFVMFCAGIDEQGIEEICQDVLNKLDKINVMMNEEFKVLTSYGTCTTGVETHLTLDECIENADGKMYKNKYMKKKKL